MGFSKNRWEQFKYAFGSEMLNLLLIIIAGASFIKYDVF